MPFIKREKQSRIPDQFCSVRIVLANEAPYISVRYTLPFLPTLFFPPFPSHLSSLNASLVVPHPFDFPGVIAATLHRSFARYLLVLRNIRCKYCTLQLRAIDKTREMNICAGWTNSLRFRCLAKFRQFLLAVRVAKYVFKRASFLPIMRVFLVRML